jgi:flagellar hook-associated protein 1
MGLTSALSAAKSGLAVTQANIDLVARNIANANSVGYTRKVLSQEATGSGVRILDVGRTVSEFLHARLRGETSAYAEMDVRRQFAQQIDHLFGSPGAAHSLDSIVNTFTQSLQQLTASPDSYAARAETVADAQTLAQQLRQMSTEVQRLRQRAEDGLDEAINRVNQILGELHSINQALSVAESGTRAPVELLDRRDLLLGELSEYLDIRVRTNNDNTVGVMTASGNSLLEGDPVNLVFDRNPAISAVSQYHPDPSQRQVGTVKLVSSNGYEIDLIHHGVLSSGRIGAFIDLRDNVLVEAQAQLDELAHGLSLALSQHTVEGEGAIDGAQQGFDIDISAVQPGDRVTLVYTQTPPGVQRTVSIVRVDDPSQLPLSNDVTAEPNDTVIGVDFSGGMAGIVAALAAELGPDIDVSSPGAGTLRFLDDGAANTIDIQSVSARVTATGLQDEGLGIPLFTDAGQPYTASLNAGSQKLGFAGRISVNPAVLADNELLVRYVSNPETPLGDASRPLDMLARLTETTLTFSPRTGIGQAGRPFTGSVVSFAQTIVATQSAEVQRIEQRFGAQVAVVESLQERLQLESGVDVDSELANLLALQNAYAANARVLQVAAELMRLLLDR